MHTSDGLLLLTLITAFINEAHKRCRLHHLLVMHLDYNLTMALCKSFLLTYLLVAFDPHVVTTFLSPVFLLLQQH